MVLDLVTDFAQGREGMLITGIALFATGLHHVLAPQDAAIAFLLNFAGITLPDIAHQAAGVVVGLPGLTMVMDTLDRY